MFRKLKFWLLTRLLDDISSRLAERRGCVYLGDIRACAAINHMAVQAWGVNDNGEHN